MCIAAFNVAISSQEARMGEKRVEYIVLVRKPEGKRNFGRSKRR